MQFLMEVAERLLCAIGTVMYRLAPQGLFALPRVAPPQQIVRHFGDRFTLITPVHTGVRMSKPEAVARPRYLALVPNLSAKDEAAMEAIRLAEAESFTH